MHSHLPGGQQRPDISQELGDLVPQINRAFEPVRREAAEFLVHLGREYEDNRARQAPGQLRSLMPPPLEQQIPTVLLRQVPAPTAVEPVTLGQLGTREAILERMPAGWWCCTCCGATGARKHLKATHRRIPDRHRWWHWIPGVRPGWSRCQRQEEL